jgi:hypothetical protein
MEIDFWYSDIISSSGIRDSLEKLGIPFKNIDNNLVDESKTNFLVFVWETQWSFPTTTYTHSYKFVKLIQELQNKNFYFIADYGGESHNRPDSLSLSFLDKIKLNGVDINRLIIANNNSNKVSIHKVEYGSYILNTCFFPNFFLSTYNHLKNYIGINNAIFPDKNFLCLNRRMYYHKYQIIEELFNRGLLDTTRFSWVDNKNTKNLSNKNLINHLNIDVNNFKAIQLENDVMYGSELSTHEEYLYTINPHWYYKSKINIITETNFNESEIHITEKTWKAIYLGVPFVISASKGHLKTLRDMGFKTFNSVINEEYDEMTGDNKIVQIINSAEALMDIYNSKEVLEICKFNQELYFNLAHRKHICKTRFLNNLYNIENIINFKSLI